MNIILFTHPDFLGSQSMPRYATMLKEAMIERGENVEVWTAKGRFVKLPFPVSLKKWLGYLDQYLIFPIEVKWRLIHKDKDTLFVFTDHALGPWVPLVAKRKHIIHCHDFLAQRSALGEIIDNPTSWSGRLYQAYIRRGYRQGQHFISVSEKTREDLSRFLLEKPRLSEVVYNAINPRYVPVEKLVARKSLSAYTKLDLVEGYLLHVGGNQWYKNRIGVIALYDAWRKITINPSPLLLVGQSPSVELKKEYEKSSFKEDIHFLANVSDQDVHLAYSGATLFLFPSLAEGFGWPIAEAMASGCLVATTDEAPMTEVAGGAALLLSRMPSEKKDFWAMTEAKKMEEVIISSKTKHDNSIIKGLANVKRFDLDALLDRIHAIYKLI